MSDRWEERRDAAIECLRRLKADFKMAGANATTMERAIQVLMTVPSAARPAPTGEKVLETRNDEAGFVEFINEDVPYVVRDISGPVAILLDVETRAIIGYRVYNQANASTAEHEPVACEHDWEKTHEDLCMFVCAKCRKAFSGNVISNAPAGWSGKYQGQATHAESAATIAAWNRRARPSPTGEKVEAAGKRLASAAENFAKRFSMNNLAEDDDRQRQAVLDQVRLFRAALEAERDEAREVVAKGLAAQDHLVEMAADWKARTTTAERERDEARASLVLFRQNHRDGYDAFSAMRNDINEMIGNLESQESTLLRGPEMSNECEAVANAVRAHVAAAESALATANARVERLVRALRKIDALDEAMGHELKERHAFEAVAIARAALTGGADGEA